MKTHHAPRDEETAIKDTTPQVAAVFVAHHRALLAFLERRVGSRAVAEDILQDAFVRGMGRVDADNDESIIAWFYRTLRNAAVDHHRRRKTAGKALESFAAETDGQVVPDVELKDAVCQCVKRLADTLKPEYAAALKRIEIDGVAVKDHATEAGISASNASVRVFRARDALRTQVFRSCGTCAEHGCLSICNAAAVLVPTFNDPNDRIALRILGELVRDRPVICIHAVDLVLGQGTLHCLTQQQPIGPRRPSSSRSTAAPATMSPARARSPRSGRRS